MQLVSVEKKVFKDGLQNLWRDQEIRHGGLTAKKNIEFTPLLGEGPQSLSRAEQRTLRAINPIPLHSAVHTNLWKEVCPVSFPLPKLSLLWRSLMSLTQAPCLRLGKSVLFLTMGCKIHKEGKSKNSLRFLIAGGQRAQQTYYKPKNIWC